MACALRSSEGRPLAAAHMRCGRGADVTDILRPAYYDKLRPAIRKLNPAI